MGVPILDLTEQYRSMKSEIDAAIAAVLESGVFIGGPNVKAFEAELASLLGVEHAIAMNSGTDALHLALRALDVGPGDEVITTPFTFVATTEAIGIVGATPKFVDIEPATYNLDIAQVESAITPRTKAIIPVHLYGAPADMPALMRIAKRHDIAVVEDCAQSIGAEIGNQKTGTFGQIGCFSFFPSKNLGAYGDGGLAVTRSAQLAARLRALRTHGGTVKYHHEALGINSRLDELQAAILRVKLPHLQRWTEARRAVARRYDKHLAGLQGITTPKEPLDSYCVYHQYTIRLENRDAVRDALHKSGIQTMVYYPVPLHLQEVHHSLGLPRGSFPHAEAASDTVLSLPIYPELTASDQDQVIGSLASLATKCEVA